MKRIMQNTILYLVVFFTTILLGTLISSKILNVIIPPPSKSMVDATVTKTPLAALKERCRATFSDNMNEEVADDFVSFIEYNDEEILAVYYRLYNNGNDNKFVIVPNKEAEEPWMAFLHQIKNETATQENLWQFTFYLSLDEDVLRVSGGDIREA